MITQRGCIWNLVAIVVTDNSERPPGGITRPQAGLALLTLQAYLSVCNEAFGPLWIHACELLSSDPCCSKATLHQLPEHEHDGHPYSCLDPADQANVLWEAYVCHARNAVQVPSCVLRLSMPQQWGTCEAPTPGLSAGGGVPRVSIAFLRSSAGQAEGRAARAEGRCCSRLRPAMWRGPFMPVHLAAQ